MSEAPTFTTQTLLTKCFRAVVLFMLLSFAFPLSVSAQSRDSLAITLTPPLFQVTQTAGSEWKSMIRMVNSNSYDIVVRVSVQDFHPNGETGNPEFENLPTGDPKDSHRMSGWVEIPEQSITIKHSTTGEIPFTVHVPPNADPGGHYAALLVGTDSGLIEGGSGSGVSSSIGSLIFLRVPGKVVEKGSIRDFYAEDSIVQSTDQSFVLRFENQGNVHLVPQGVIEISNMWGKVRGKVDINQSSTFGNVLPNSTRKFEFKWHGDSSPFEVGRYKAEATLVYGTDARSTVIRTVYFWIVPWKPVGSIVGGLFFFLWFISWSVRKYIRKALEMERQWQEAHGGVIVPPETGVQLTQSERNIRTPEITFTALKRPLAVSGVDLRMQAKAPQGKVREVQNPSSVARKTDKSSKQSSVFTTWVSQHRSFVGFLLILILGFSAIGWYFTEVFQDERAYQIEQVRPK